MSLIINSLVAKIFLLGFAFALLGTIGYSAIFLTIVTGAWRYAILAMLVLTLKLMAVVYFFIAGLHVEPHELLWAGLGYATILPAALVKTARDQSAH